MRSIFLFMNVSVDGYFEAPNDDISWATSDFEAFSLEPRREVDTLLLGRRTYEMMRSFWPTPQAIEMVPEVAKFMNETHKVVVSHHPYEAGWKNVTVIHKNVAAEIQKLKEQSGDTIGIFGSNNLCVSLMQHGLIDEFQIVVNPVALGEGTSLFKGLPSHIKLTLSSSHIFKSGTILLTYKPVR